MNDVTARTCVVGASGFSGALTAAILWRHPHVSLEAVTARRGIRELLLRATLYRARLGEPRALELARSIAAQIENPALHELIDQSTHRLPTLDVSPASVPRL